MVGGWRKRRKAKYEMIYIKSKENKEAAQPEAGKSKIWVLNRAMGISAEDFQNVGERRVINICH